MNSPTKTHCLLIINAMIVVTLTSCGGPTAVSPTEEAVTLQLPTSFRDLSSSTDPCPADQAPAINAELVYASTATGGGVVLIFDTAVPLDDLDYEAVIVSGDDEFDFSCSRAAQSATQLQCSGPSLDQGKRTSLSVRVQTTPSTLFRLDETAPVLYDALKIPDSFSLEETWDAFYACMDEPQGPECVAVEQFAFPYPDPVTDLLGLDEDPGVILLWPNDSLSADPRDRPVYPLTYFNMLEALAEDVPPNCLVALRPLANACAPWAFMPLEVPEIVALEDIMFTVEYVWNENASYYDTLFVTGDYRYTTGELYHEPLDPDDWTYADLEEWSDYWCCGWLDYEGVPECIEFMVESKACYEEHGWDLFPPPPEPNCATEAATAIVNQCLAESDLAGTGLVPTIEVGDVEGLAEGITYLYSLWTVENMLEYLQVRWQAEPETYDDLYPCAPYETLACIEDWIEYQREYGTFFMTASSLPPECDPEFPDSLWCQGMDEDDPATQAASDCAEEIGWTGNIGTRIERDLLLHTIALGLPWVDDLNGFPACRQLYNLSAPGFIQQYGRPLHSPAVCTSVNNSGGELILEAAFEMPAVASTGIVPAPTATEASICVITLPPDASPCWIWNPELCIWECFN